MLNRPAATKFGLALKAFVFAGLVTIGTAAPAQMQSDGPPLPRVQMVDEAGVDLRSGRRTDTAERSQSGRPILRQ